MEQEDTVYTGIFCFGTILKNVCKNKWLILGFLISAVCITGLSIQVQAQAQTRKAAPYMLPLMHRRKRQKQESQPVRIGVSSFASPDRSVQDSMGIHLVGHWTGSSGDGISVSGNYAYVIDNSDSLLRIIDISDPSNPTQVGSYNPGEPFSSYDASSSLLGVSGGFVYLAIEGKSSNWQLLIIDVSNPANPHQVGSYNLDDPGNNIYDYGVSVAGSYAYETVEYQPAGQSLSQDIRVIDMSNPANPQQVGSYKFAWATIYNPVKGYVFASNGYVYLLRNIPKYGDYTSSWEFEVIDVRNPANPLHVGSYQYDDPSSAPQKIIVKGKYAYIVSNGTIFGWQKPSGD